MVTMHVNIIRVSGINKLLLVFCVLCASAGFLSASSFDLYFSINAANTAPLASPEVSGSFGVKGINACNNPTSFSVTASTTQLCAFNNTDSVILAVSNVLPSPHPPYFYQWYKAGNLLQGQTNDSLMVTSDNSALGSGNYSVRVGTSVANGGCYLEVSQRVTFRLNALNYTDTICQNMAPDSIIGSLPSTGFATPDYQWQVSANDSVFSDIAGATSKDYKPDTIKHAGIHLYKRLVFSSSCPDTIVSNVVAILVDTNDLHPGTILTSEYVCRFSAPLLKKGTSPKGGSDPKYKYMWFADTSKNNGSPYKFDTIANSNSEDLPNPPTLKNLSDPTLHTPKFFFKREVTSGKCKADTTVAVYTVPAIDPGTISESHDWCSDKVPVNFTLTSTLAASETPPSPVNYLWMYYVKGSHQPIPAPTITNSETLTLTTSQLSDTTYIVRRAVGVNTVQTACDTNYTDPVRIVKLAPVNPGRIRAGTVTICKGNAVNIESVAPAKGGKNGLKPKYQWKISTDGILYQDLTTKDTLASYVTPALQNSDTVYYKRFLYDECDTIASNPFTVFIRNVSAQPVYLSDPGPVCKIDAPVTLIATNGGPSYLYTWTKLGAGVQGKPTLGDSIFKATTSGTYLVEITNATGCKSTADTTVLTIENPMISISADPNEINPGESSTLTVLPNKDVLQVQVLSSDPSFAQSNQYVYGVTPDTTTLYSAVATSKSGCRATSAVRVLVLRLIKTYEAFSPNGDDVNPTWIIDNIQDYPEPVVRIFNRWGNIVFEQRGYNNQTAWDGTRNGEKLPAGVYYYIVDSRSLKGRPPFQGTVTIIR